MNYLCADRNSRHGRALADAGHKMTYFEQRCRDTVVPNINRLAERVRTSQGLVVWVRPEFRSAGAADWPIGYRDYLIALGMDLPSHPGTESFALRDDVRTEPGDYYLSKFCTSVFWGGSAGELLRTHTIANVLVVGSRTNRGVVINAIDSTHDGFRTVVVDDANAALSQDAHDHRLQLQQAFFECVSTNDIC